MNKETKIYQLGKKELKRTVEDIKTTKKVIHEVLPSGTLGKKVYKGSVPKNTYSKRFF